MILGTIETIQVGRPRHFNDEGDSAKPWTSAICKTPVQGAIQLGWTNLDGDEQADLKHHGGPDKAVLAYSAAHYNTWKDELPDAAFEHGAFGENLTVSGLNEADCCVGDVMQIGDCQLQISQPRQPCWKLSRRWNLPKLAVLVQQTGRTGWYYRVIERGTFEPGSSIHLIDRPFPEFTVKKASEIMYAKPRSPNNDLALAQCPALSASWKETLTKRATKGIAPDTSKRLDG